MKNGSVLLNTEKNSSLNVLFITVQIVNTWTVSSLSTKSEYSVTEVGDFLIILEDEKMNCVKNSFLSFTTNILHEFLTKCSRIL